MNAPSNTVLSKYMMQNKRLKVFIKSNPKEAYQNQMPSKKKFTSISSFSSRSFIKKSSKVDPMLILGPVSQKSLNQEILNTDSQSREILNKKISPRSVTPSLMDLKNKKFPGDIKSFRNLLNDLLDEKCLKCNKSKCECEEQITKRSHSVRKMNKKSSAQRLIQGSSNGPAKTTGLKSEENELCILNKRKISFSSFHEKGFVKIHSEPKQKVRSPRKIIRGTANKSKKTHTDLDLAISASPVCFSSRPK